MALVRVPEDMTGKSFLDVGCWEGNDCIEARRHGAITVVGLDLCTSPELHANLAQHPFTFVQADILSEKIGGLLFLETTIHAVGPATQPLLLFHPDDSFDHNPSNWWTPNTACLHQMLRVAGFGDADCVYRSGVDQPFGRTCVRARAASTAQDLSLKVLPRRPEYMSTAQWQRSVPER